MMLSGVGDGNAWLRGNLQIFRNTHFARILSTKKNCHSSPVFKHRLSGVLDFGNDENVLRLHRPHGPNEVGHPASWPGPFRYPMWTAQTCSGQTGVTNNTELATPAGWPGSLSVTMLGDGKNLPGRTGVTAKTELATPAAWADSQHEASPPRRLARSASVAVPGPPGPMWTAKTCSSKAGPAQRPKRSWPPQQTGQGPFRSPYRVLRRPPYTSHIFDLPTARPSPRSRR